eukprot:1210820-Rhodomonas_salina.2
MPAESPSAALDDAVGLERHHALASVQTLNTVRNTTHRTATAWRERAASDLAPLIRVSRTRTLQISIGRSGCGRSRTTHFSISAGKRARCVQSEAACRACTEAGRGSYLGEREEERAGRGVVDRRVQRMSADADPVASVERGPDGA